MRLSHRIRATLAVAASIAFASCSDVPSPTQPLDFEPNAGILDSGLNDLQQALNQPVEVLRRTEPLATDEVVSKVIGRRGGVIVLPRAGLVVRFPRRALRERTRITVTAPAGDLVGYHFEPHGLEFRRSVRVAQDLSRTEANGLLGGMMLQGAYFEGQLEPVVTALELLDLDIFGELLGVFRIDHFSGYVIATD